MPNKDWPAGRLAATSEAPSHVPSMFPAVPGIFSAQMTDTCCSDSMGALARIFSIFNHTRISHHRQDLVGFIMYSVEIKSVVQGKRYK
jgi:hypothetical protein